MSSSSAPVGAADRQLAPSRAVAASLAAADGRPIATLVARPDSTPRGVVVLVPGYTGSKEDFAPLLDPLAGAGFQAVAVDLPGQYESPGPDDPAAYTPDALAADLVSATGALRAEATARSTDSPLHLLGHSYGGLVARAAVLAAPAAFDSLVLLDSGPAAIGGQRRVVIDAMEPVLAGQGLAAVYEATLELSRRDPRWAEPPASLGRFLRTRFLASSATGLAGMGRAIRDEPDRTDDLAALAPPCLVVSGADDDAWSVPEQADMARRLGAEHVIIDGAAHSPAVENPAALADVLLAFWTRLLPR